MKKIFTILFLLCIVQSTFSQQINHDARMGWWRNAKFGMFIHWGLYAVPAGEYKGDKNHAEWIMNTANIPIAEYEKYAAEFNPTSFDAEQWVKMAKNAGMKYIVITSKHHDGFCLWDSKVSDYDVMDRTPFKRDIMKELSVACKKYGIQFCMYHSIMDWHHPDENKKNINAYTNDYLKPCLKELVTTYDPAVLWFDGEWVEEWTTNKGDSLYNWLLSLKPNLIVNNRVSKGRNGMQGMNNKAGAGDFGTPEQEILEEKNDNDWESCMTMNNHWGFNKNDQHWKSANQLVWNLVDIISKGGNYLLNIGPTAQGLFPDTSILRLQQIGDWFKVNNEAVYGLTTWKYFSEGDGIRYASNKKGEVYVYVNGFPGNNLLLRKIKPKAGSTISLLGCSQKLTWKDTPEGIVVNIPSNLTYTPQVSDVYVFKLTGTPQNLSAVPQIGSAEETMNKTKVIANQVALVPISATEKSAVIRYTLDGSNPTSTATLYTKPIEISATTTIKAIARSAGKMWSDVALVNVLKGKYALDLKSTYSSQYAALGPVTLVDGQFSDPGNFHKNWMGFEGKDLEVVLDLGAEKTFNKVFGSFLQRQGDWIFLPSNFNVAISSDGNNFSSLGEVSEPLPNELNTQTESKKLILQKTATARYVKIKAKNVGVCPAWHAGNGGKAWIFVDELGVE